MVFILPPTEIIKTFTTNTEVKKTNNSFKSNQKEVGRERERREQKQGRKLKYYQT